MQNCTTELFEKHDEVRAQAPGRCAQCDGHGRIAVVDGRGLLAGCNACSGSGEAGYTGEAFAICAACDGTIAPWDDGVCSACERRARDDDPIYDASGRRICWNEEQGDDRSS